MPDIIEKCRALTIAMTEIQNSIRLSDIEKTSLVFVLARIRDELGIGGE